MDNSRQRGSPPYLSYATFRSFLDTLAKLGVPNRIDPGVMMSMSGTNQSLLINTLRYLDLVSENNRPNPELDLLINAEGIERQKLWRQILAKAYPSLINSEFNLEGATTEEVHVAFRNQGVSSPDTVRKCVTFFSRAAKDAGIRLSPHVKPYAGTRPSTRTARYYSKAAHDSRVDQALPTDDKKEKGETYLGLLLTKVPDFDPGWTKEQVDNWLLAIAKLNQITREAVGVNGSSSEDAIGITSKDSNLPFD